MFSIIFSAILIQICREHIHVDRIACLRLGPAREWKRDTNYHCTWKREKAVWQWPAQSDCSVIDSCKCGARLTAGCCQRREVSFLSCSPSPSQGQLYSVSHSKAEGEGVTYLASFKLHQLTKWSNKDHWCKLKDVCPDPRVVGGRTRSLWLHCRPVCRLTQQPLW